MPIVMPQDDMQLFDLSQPLFNGMPCSPNHPGFRMSLVRRHGDHVRPDGTSASNEMIVTGGHVGTHIDGLAHVSHEGSLHGGVDAGEAQRGGRFNAHGIDEVAPMVGRGILLDVAAWQGVDVLPGGYGISASDLKATATHFNLSLEGIDFVLVRSGWATHFTDPAAFLGLETGVPGPTEAAATWLAECGIVATGADTIAYEQIPPGAGHRNLPVHRVLLVEHGIHIIEAMNLDPLAAAGVYDFGLFLAPLKIVGATGSPLRPVAWSTDHGTSE